MAIVSRWFSQAEKQTLNITRRDIRQTNLCWSSYRLQKFGAYDCNVSNALFYYVQQVNRQSSRFSSKKNKVKICICKFVVHYFLQILHNGNHFLQALIINSFRVVQGIYFLNSTIDNCKLYAYSKTRHAQDL